MTAIGAGRDAWRRYDEDGGPLSIADIYTWRWNLYTGDAFSTLAATSPYLRDTRIYANTRLLYKHVSAVVTFYQGTVYQGDLSTDGQPLPDGTRGAIPIDPQVKGEEAQQQLMTALSELFSAWNWKQNMTLRPMYGSALGDVLTELVDEPARGLAYPSIVWPGYVKDIDLDYVGNVKAYTLEYMVTEKDDYGNTETYKFTKMVDKEAFRYFKRDEPFDYYGDGAVVKNPYGFVPAIWDRHQIRWGVRGAAATDSTWQALQELNALLSHGKDFQHKAFAAPIVVRGRITSPGQTAVQLGTPPTTQQQAAASAENIDFLQGDENAGIEQPVFDIGQTLAMADRIKEGILDENPEASFYAQLRSMSQVTAPGAERLLGDAVSRCRLVRAGYDMNTVKLFQMAIAMNGMRANLPAGRAGGWARPLTARQLVFKPYDLDSYKKGLMDFSISDRPVVLPTESERLALIAQRESLVTRYGLKQAGVDAADIDRIMQDRGYDLIADMATDAREDAA